MSGRHVFDHREAAEGHASHEEGLAPLMGTAAAGTALPSDEIASANGPFRAALAAAQDGLAVRAVLLQGSPQAEGVAGVDSKQVALGPRVHRAAIHAPAN